MSPKTLEEVRESHGAEDTWEVDAVQIVKDGDGECWIGPDREDAGLGLLFNSREDEFVSALESAGVLPDADADASETGESGDVTPVTDVGDLCAGDRVTATDDIGMSDTGTLESVEVNLNPMNNPYHVEFSDGSRWYATHVEPSAESRSPEDVAETWWRAVERSADVTFWPVNDDTEASTDTNGNITFDGPVGIYGDPAPLGNEPGDRRPTEFSPWVAHESVEAVDAADLPFSEVPTDD